MTTDALNDALNFIEQDLKRRASPALSALFVIGAALGPAILGIALRGNWESAITPRVFIPNLMATLLLGIAAWLGQRRKRGASGSVSWILIFAVFLAIERAVFPPGGVRTEFPSSEAFWHQTSDCFIHGAIVSAILGAWLGVFAFTFSPLPARRWRALFSFAAGVSGAVMLGFHCDSSQWSHVLIGHLGQGLIAGAVIFAAFEIAFRRRLRAQMPELMARFKNAGRLG